MTIDDRAQENVESQTQPEPMPSSEQKTVEEQPSVEAPQGVAEQTTETQLPDSAKERTKAEFEKLQDKLREERTRREYLETVFNSMQSKPKEQKPEENPEPMYDPQTGLLNERYLTEVDRRAREAEERARRAEESIKGYEQQKVRDYDEIQRRDAFTAYPQLNPKEKNFDRELHVATRRVLLDSMANPDDYGGKEISFKEAADIASKSLPKALQTAKDEGARDAIENLTPKEQAALEATGTYGRRNQLSDDFETLRDKSRRNDVDAIAERLRRIRANQKK